MRLFLLGVGVAVMLSACGSTVPLDNVPVVDRSVSAGANAGAGGDGAAGGGNTDGAAVVRGTVASVDLAPHATDAAVQGLARVIYFDYDSSSIRAEFQPVIEAHARYLAANANRKVVLEGHTDDRGGREYNLALGQKRAEAVRRAFTLLGVQDAQLEAVSFGKEKPAVAGDSEAAMEKNRRVEISYQ